MARLELAVDRVITKEQAQRRYNFTVAELRRLFCYRPAEVKPLARSSRFVQTAFVALPSEEEFLRWAPAWELAHLAGTAEIRTLLGASVDDWTLDEATMRGNRPDAVWRRGEQVVAVEYDAGYPPKVVAEKIQSFQDYDALVWGTPSAVRMGHLRSVYHRPERQFVLADLTATVVADRRSGA